MNKKINMIAVGPTAHKAGTDEINRAKRGSVLVLTIVAVLILSLMVSGLLDVGSTEVNSTQNYQFSKSAYYTAVQGIEEIRNLIYNNPDPQSVTAIKRYTSGLEGPILYGDDAGNGTKYIEKDGTQSSYITGTMKDMEVYYEGGYSDSTEVETLNQLEGFKAPPLPSISMGTGSSIAPVVWKVNVTSEVIKAGKASYSEIVSGIYSILTVSY